MKKNILLLSSHIEPAAYALLQQAAQQAGLGQNAYDIADVATFDPASSRSRGYRCLVALGDAAAGACLGDSWKGGWANTRRGYVWDGAEAGKILTTLHPEDCLLRKDPSGINGMLLTADLERAKYEASFDGIRRRHRNVSVISDRGSTADAVRAVRDAGWVACDIECYDSERLQCIGFATSPEQAYVFVGEATDAALELIEDDSVHKIFQNGQFDAYFLQTRCGAKLAGWTDDCMIGWHALWIEIAGKGKSGSKRTRKSLAFLASVYTKSPEWWKEYEDADDAAMYELNGRDCCITYEIMQAMLEDIAEQDVEAIYRHEMSMMPVLVAIQERGLCVDEDQRSRAVAELGRRAASTATRIKELAEPLLRERRDRLAKPHLFFGTRRCSCCNGGKSKTAACWSCAGLASAPGKKAAAELNLQPCKECSGAGKFETFEFNHGSPAQQVELFYNVLGLQKRYNNGKLTVDEKNLKAALAEVG